MDFIVSKFVSMSSNKSRDASSITESEFDLEKELFKFKNRGTILKTQDFGKLLKEVGKS